MHLIGWLSPHCLVVYFSGALIYSLIWAIFFVLVCLLHSKEQDLSICQGEQLTLLHFGTNCGGGVREGTVQLAQRWASFQSLPPLSTSKLGPSGADSWWVDLCTF